MIAERKYFLKQTILVSLHDINSLKWR